MSDTEALAGYLSRYLARRADTARDPVDWAGQRLYALVANKLRDDPALQELADEASAGERAISPATLRRTALALVAATEHDPNFARALAMHLQTCEATGPARSQDDDTAQPPGHGSRPGYGRRRLQSRLGRLPAGARPGPRGHPARRPQFQPLVRKGTLRLAAVSAEAGREEDPGNNSASHGPRDRHHLRRRASHGRVPDSSSCGSSHDWINHGEPACVLPRLARRC